ncbi:MAG: PKD domain-containing protein, partial [Candidatus Aenigmarchaeota archaeon]|nr:PKD domain-containing protein [Candidatus Aenigmarchaeota archaeon]
IINSTIKNITAANATITNSSLSNTTATNSLIINSTIFDTSFDNATIIDDIIYNGTVLLPNGSEKIVTNSTSMTDVMNYGPSARFSFSSSYLSVSFMDTSIDPNIPGDLNDMLSYLWNFGDGSLSTIKNPVHAYGSAGSYIARLNVTDKSGKADSYAATITVSAAPPAPSGGGGGGGGFAMIVKKKEKEEKETGGGGFEEKKKIKISAPENIKIKKGEANSFNVRIENAKNMSAADIEIRGIPKEWYSIEDISKPQDEHKGYKVSLNIPSGESIEDKNISISVSSEGFKANANIGLFEEEAVQNATANVTESAPRRGITAFFVLSPRNPLVWVVLVAILIAIWWLFGKYIKRAAVWLFEEDEAPKLENEENEDIKEEEKEEDKKNEKKPSKNKHKSKKNKAEGNK